MTEELEEVLVLATIAEEIDILADITPNKKELDRIATDIDDFIQLSGEQDNEWCVLEEELMIKAHFSVRLRHGHEIAKKFFIKQMELFQDVSRKVKIIGQMANDGMLSKDFGKSFFDAARRVCLALKDFTQAIANALTVEALDKAFDALFDVYKGFLVEFEQTKDITESAANNSSSVSSIFGVIKWVVKYWTIMYLIGAFLYNVYHYSELFEGGHGILDLCANIFGCLCMAFVGSAYAAGHVIKHAIKVIDNIIQSTTPSFKTADVVQTALKYLGTAFLSGWVVSVSRCVCLMVTQSARLNLVGMTGAVWDSIQQVGWKAWTSTTEAMIWVNGVIADNGKTMFRWFMEFTTNVIWKRFTSAISAFVGSATTTSVVHGLIESGIDSKSITLRAIEQLKSVDSDLFRLVQQTVPKMKEDIIETLDNFLNELKYTTVNTDMTVAIQTMALNDVNAILERPADKPKVGVVRNLINQGYSKIISVMFLIFTIVLTQVMLLRGV